MMGNAVPPTIVTSTQSGPYTADFFGDQFTYGLFEFDVDQDLSYLSTPGFCPKWNGTCAPSLLPGANCTCDYIAEYDVFCNPSYQPSQHRCNCPTPQGWCRVPDPQYNYIYLNDSLAPSKMDLDTRYLSVITFNAYSADCSPIVFRLKSPGPTGVTILQTSGLSNTTFDLLPDSTFIFCPGDVHWGRTMYLYFGTFPLNRTLEVARRPPTPVRTPSGNCTLPPEYQASHICIESGIQVSLSSPSPALLRFAHRPAQKCGTLIYASSTDLTKISLDDPWMVFGNSSGALQNRQLEGNRAPGVIGYCLGPNQDYIFGIIYLLEPATLFIDTNQDWIDILPIDNIAPYTYPPTLVAGATITCGNKSFTQWKPATDEVGSVEDGTINVRFIWPQQEPTPFYPQPVSSGWAWKYIPPSFLGPSIPRRVTLSVLLSQRLFPVPSENINFINYEWITPEEFPSCTVTFNRLLVNSAGEPIAVTVSNFTQASTACDYTLFAAQNDEIEGILLTFTTDVIAPIADQAAANYRISLIMSSRNWLNCKASVDQLVTHETTATLSPSTATCTAAFGSPEYLADPCCFEPVSSPEYETGCFRAPRTVQKNTITISGQVDAQCPTAQCAKNILQDLNIFENREADPTTRCSQTDKFVYDKKIQQTFWFCYYRHYGLEPFRRGLPCQHDSDCLDGVCSVSQQSCVPMNKTQQVYLFLDCLLTAIQNTDQYVLSELAKFTNTTLSSDVTQMIPGILAGFPGLNEACGNAHYLTARSIGTDFRKVIGGGPGCFGSYCPPYWTVFVLNLDDVPLYYDCLVPNSEDCSMVSGEGSSVCPFDGCTTLTPYPYSRFFVCFTGPDFCGICEDGQQCQELSAFPLVSGTCPYQVCVLANGTIIETDAATCLTLNSCTSNPGYPVNTSAECDALGICSDADPRNPLAIFRDSWSAFDGACLVSFKWNEPLNLGKDLCPSPFRTTAIGCLMFGAPQAACTPFNAWGLEAILTVSAARWIKKATNQQECAAYGQKCVGPPRASKVPSVLIDYITQTLECDGVVEDMFTWKPARWLPGQPRTLQPSAKNWIRPFDTPGQAPVIDIQLLYVKMKEFSDQHYSLISRSETFCRVSRQVEYYSELVCSCGAQFPESQCFETTNVNHTDLLLVACALDPRPITQYPITFILAQNSLPNGVCELVYVKIVSINQFSDTTRLGLATALLTPSKDPAWAYFNQNEAVIGTVLTDGFVVTGNTQLMNTTVCFPLSSLRGAFDLNSYPVLDIAYSLNSDRTLIPLNVSVTYDPNTTFFCAAGVDFQRGASYFFVNRVQQDWTVIQRSPFSPNEIAYISVCLALYVIGFIVATFGLLFQIFAQKTFVLFVLIVMVSFFVFRIVLFTMALASPEAIVGSPAIGYVLIEFPLVLFFCFVSVFIMSWGTVVRISESLDDKDIWIKAARFLTIAFNCIVLGLFILMIILFETLVDDPYFVCEGTVLVKDSDQSFALIMSYRAIFSSLALILGSCLIVVGYLILKVIFQTGVAFATKAKVALATAFGAFGLFAQAIYYLVITASRVDQSVYLSLSILLIDEIIPALCFLACAITLPDGKEIRSKLGKSFSRGSSTKKSSTVSIGKTDN